MFKWFKAYPPKYKIDNVRGGNDKYSIARVISPSGELVFDHFESWGDEDIRPTLRKAAWTHWVTAYLPWHIFAQAAVISSMVHFVRLEYMEVPTAIALWLTASTLISK